MDRKDTVVVTGGAGFIGANFVEFCLTRTNAHVVTLDKLTYAGNLENLDAAMTDPRHTFVRGDIGDQEIIPRLLRDHNPVAIINFAAESHVDRSIHAPEAFVETNVAATCRLLQSALRYYLDLPNAERARFRFLHVSTDEVYGSLAAGDPAFTETTPYAPNSPYAASKAASDHLVRAWHHTFGLPTLTTNCSNNYGPYQFPEKLLPLMITRALSGGDLPIYGDGTNVRDWLYVKDHCQGIWDVLQRGTVGETYNIGGDSEMTNLEVVGGICSILDQRRPRADGKSYAEQIRFVEDRPGHDRRYAIDARKIRAVVGWAPRYTFAKGLEETIDWYLDSSTWLQNVTSGQYREWLDTNYARRGDAS